MKTLIVAAGRFDQGLAAEIAAGKEPRLDMFELERALGAGTRLLDFGDVDRSQRPELRAIQRALGDSVALAYLALQERGDADAFFTSGEDIGLPLAMLLKVRGIRASHTMIAHAMGPLKKRVLVFAGARSRLDRVLCYATLQQKLLIEELGLAGASVERINYHADERFFRALGGSEEPDLICGAGQLLRDYETLIRATEGLNVRVRIAAGSPWIAQPLNPSRVLPGYVDWRRYNRFELRALYDRAALAVVPLLENDYQTGISTILEMMAMGKCVIATRTRGQTDTIVDGVNGVYVPPGDAAALRAAIERLLADPAERARIGRAARAFIEREAGLDRFVERVIRAIHEGHAARFDRAV